MHNEKYRIEENIVNIAMRAAELLKDGRIERDDMTGHAGLTDMIIQLAEAFEKKNLGVDFDAEDRDYWLEIDEFAEEQLIKELGVERPEPAQDLNIKVIISDGIVEEVLKDQGIPVQVEVVDMDVDYEDYDKLKAYSEELYHDPNLQRCLYTVANFQEEEPDITDANVPAQNYRSLCKVVAVHGNAEFGILFSGTWDQCMQFCEENNWYFWDENNFCWDIGIEDPREALFPEGYYTAVDFFCNQVGADIQSEFVRQNAEKLVSCYLNNLDYEDFVAWAGCDKALGETLSITEFTFLKEKYDIASLNDPAYSVFVDGIRNSLGKFREHTLQKTSKDSLNAIIQSAAKRSSENNVASDCKKQDLEQDR